jgi:YVTN family beta-propeller protein
MAMARFTPKGGLAIAVALLAGACAEQRFRLGFEPDTASPTVAVTVADTVDVQNGLEFKVDASDNLGLKTISVQFTAGLTGQTQTFTTATTTFSWSVQVPQTQTATLGGPVLITATAVDGAGNTATDTVTIIALNPKALIVTLIRPTAGAITAPGKQIPIEIKASQQDGLVFVGWQTIPGAAAVNATDTLFTPTLPDTVVMQDTLTVPTTVSAGTFGVVGFAKDKSGRVATTSVVLVTVQLVIADTTGPLVTFQVAQRAEALDTITVRARDPSGISLVGWKALDATGTQLSGQNTTLGGTLTDVSVLNSLRIPSGYTGLVVIKAWATDGAGNTDSARVDTLNAASGVLADSIVVVNGLTKRLPSGGHVVDAIYDRNNNRVYLTNFDRNQVEVFDVTDTSFKAPIPVGSRPWGIALWPRDTLGNNADTVVVANSGGTDLSIVDVSLGRERRRHALPNFIIQSVKVEITNDQVVPPAVALKITEYDFSDRPQYLAMTCRVAGGTACSPTGMIAVYSTAPTPAQQGAFPQRGTMRWENLTSAAPESHFFWEQAEKAPSPDIDTLQVIVDRGPVLGSDVLLGASCGRTVNMIELGFSDSTFTRNSGNFTHALIGEGGSGVDPALDFARAMSYNVSAGVTVSACPAINLAGVLFVGREEVDDGISPGIRVRDFLVNTAVPVRSIGINFNGLTNLFRADSVYVFDEGLRLRGMIGATGVNAGMDLNFNHAFQAGTGGTPGTSGGTLDPNDRLAFMASTDPEIDVFDTYFWGLVSRIPIRDPVIGPLRVARLGSGQQMLVGVTARGVVTVQIPSITNIYPANRWGGSTR